MISINARILSTFSENSLVRLECNTRVVAEDADVRKRSPLTIWIVSIFVGFAAGRSTAGS